MSIDYKKLVKQLGANKPLLYISPFLIYLVVSYLFFGPAHFTDIHRKFFTPSGDPYAFTWYLKWWPYALSHGLNPIFERFVYYPNGFNLAWSTSIPTLGLLMAPVTATWGAITAFNVLALASLPVTALSCFYLIFYLTRKYWASVLCGFIYGFSSFQLAELLGHPCFYVSFVPPLIILIMLLRAKGRLGKKAFILLLALLVSMQFGISTEGFGALFIFGALAWLLTWLFIDKPLQPRITSMTFEVAIAGIVTLVIVSPFIRYLIVGYKDVPKVINSSLNYSADLLNYFIPTKITLIGGGTFEHVSKNFAGNPSEQAAYLSIPLILFIIGYSARYWKRWYVKVMGVSAAVIAICSLGPKLQINGKIEPATLPWSITNNLPVLRSMLPTRFPQYLFLIAAIMLGLWLTYSPRKVKPERARLISGLKYGLVVLIILLLLPRPSAYTWQDLHIPYLFTPKLAQKYLGPNTNILILPYNNGADPEIWQANADMNFKTANGYLGFVPPFVIGNPTAVQISSDMPGSNFKENFLIFCKSHQIAKIVYTPHGATESPVLVSFIQTLGWPTSTAGGATIVEVPPQYH